MENFAHYADWAYLIGAILFILALRGLSSPASAIMGNRYGMIGMALAVLATFAVVANLKHGAWQLVRHCIVLEAASCPSGQRKNAATCIYAIGSS